ncbi:hypothetical protein CFAL_04070 [Corynebacterium falsenii DSM 44353]|uniref:hypothetical protein n=1 Tax=Corynebacterium falsenii TaxID=108486 RepID=UPI0003E9478B|nr:hypothetical protein [Corynebacterium falsenii]AHI02870.1 hypothetical protein CFAL_04070 [Corynebacterium falsenii DSM 44353]UBI03581.1 hypothetical protein LA343_05970 [Corynebacterium falsenii]UBI06412.1 hypothetical protein LA329_09035 [Corynebacterium falsenii]
MSENKWYFDTQTGEVTQGKTDSWENRMGPYDSKEEASHALEIVRQRNKAADEYDEED